MVFAVNCGPDGSNNSFTSFMNAALAIGQSLQQSAPSSASGYGYGAPAPSATPSGTVSPGSPTNGGAAPGATHTIVVGGSETLTYSPSEVSAAPGDVVVFEL